MMKNLAAVTLSLSVATGFSVEMNRSHPVEYGIAPKRLEISQLYKNRNNNKLSEIVAPTKTCGRYVILGCHQRRSAARKQLILLGGASAGGGAGMKVLNTGNYLNFRNGYYCVADGPYSTQGYPGLKHWDAIVQQAYTKETC